MKVVLKTKEKEIKQNDLLNENDIKNIIDEVEFNSTRIIIATSYIGKFAKKKYLEYKLSGYGIVMKAEIVSDSISEDEATKTVYNFEEFKTKIIEELKKGSQVNIYSYDKYYTARTNIILKLYYIKSKNVFEVESISAPYVLL